MASFRFYKYQGTGNDFIIIDNRALSFDKKDKESIQFLCHRKLGIGADGLILLENDDVVDFKMVYFNADGTIGAMCGNGGRCIIAFAAHLQLIRNMTTFRAADGLHEGTISQAGNVSISLKDVYQIEVHSENYRLNTGCPHYVTFVKDLNAIDIQVVGRSIRYDPQFAPVGINVNFVEINKKGITVSTYERGVEGETLSCGTGVTASAIAYALAEKQIGEQEILVQTKGGLLTVEFHIEEDGIKNISLTGAATLVFEGIIG